MSSNAKKLERARAKGYRTKNATTGIGLGHANDIARKLFGGVGRARYQKLFPVNHRYQVGVPTQTKGGMPGFGIIGSGGTWEAAIEDAKKRLAEAEDRAKAEAAAKEAATNEASNGGGGVVGAVGGGAGLGGGEPSSVGGGDVGSPGGSSDAVGASGPADAGAQASDGGAGVANV
jgi:hypothetical protein